MSVYTRRKALIQGFTTNTHIDMLSSHCISVCGSSFTHIHLYWISNILFWGNPQITEKIRRKCVLVVILMRVSFKEGSQTYIRCRKNIYIYILMWKPCFGTFTRIYILILYSTICSGFRIHVSVSCLLLFLR